MTSTLKHEFVDQMRLLFQLGSIELVDLQEMVETAIQINLASVLGVPTGLMRIPRKATAAEILEFFRSNIAL